jgi:hypothetical protein
MFSFIHKGENISIIIVRYISFFLWMATMGAIAWIKFEHHELWKDEWQAWFLARDLNLYELFSFLYYDGHPSLWYLYLKIFSFSAQFLSIPEHVLIQMAHFLLVAGFYTILYLGFKTPLFLKIPIALSYFLFFEYGIVNRGYALMIFLLFLYVYLFKNWKDKAHLRGIVLLLLCQTEVYAVFFAFSFVLFEILQHRNNLNIRKNSTIVLYTLVGAVIFTLSVFPREINHLKMAQHKGFELTNNVLTTFQGILGNTFFPSLIPDTVTYGFSTVGLLLSLTVLFIIIMVFRRNPPLITALMSYFLLSIIFCALFFVGGIRHWGAGFVMLVACLEINHDTQTNQKWSYILSVILVLLPVVHNARALHLYKQIPFTNAKSAGMYIKENFPVDIPIVGIHPFQISPVVGYAGRNFYEMPYGNPFSYFRWLDKIYFPTEHELLLFAKYKKAPYIIIVSPKPLDMNKFNNTKPMKKFDGENFKKENYYLYKINTL